MRTTVLGVLFTLAAPALSGQGLKLAGPPLVPRHSHVGDGALIGATVGGFAGTLVGLADRRHVCPSREWICAGPGQPIIGMLGGLGVGAVMGGAAGALVGAFIRTSGPETQVGLTVHM